MDLKIALLLGLVVGLILVIVGPWLGPPLPVPAAEIVLEDAMGQWAIGLKPHSGLILAAATVLPRIWTSHAATSGLVSPLQPSIELAEATRNVVQRIVIEHTATAAPVSLGMTGVPNATAFPRILVEYAATVSLLAPVAKSELLAEDAQRVAHKLVIENAETVNIRTLEPLPSE